MEMFVQSLTVDQTYTIPLAGRYFRILTGTGKFKVSTDNGINSTVLAGLGCDFHNPNDGRDFTEIQITPLDNDQTVEIVISSFPVTDSRLTGDVDINGVLSVVNAGGSDYAKNSVTVNATSAAKILDQNTTRASATIQLDSELHIWKDNSVGATDMTLPAGHHVIENTAELWAYNANGAAATVKVLEELK